MFDLGVIVSAAYGAAIGMRVPRNTCVKFLRRLIVPALFVFLWASRVFASENISLEPFSAYPAAWPVIGVVFVCALVGFGFGLAWFRSVSAESPGSVGMVKVADAIEEGAKAYLKRQVAAMSVLVAVIAAGLVLLYKHAEGFDGVDIRFGVVPVYLGVAIAFVLGVVFSYLAGYIGMMMAVRANGRVANAALTSFRKSLHIAFRAGGVSGMATVALGLLGACIVFFFFAEESMKVLIGFGFGGCLAALFMRIGGGIYTKAADVGADLVGKVELGIPEDDPRNAATIADNVGDNVGDCAGMAADVFESYEVTLVAAIILGAAASTELGMGAGGLALVVYPLLIRAVGVAASIIGIYCVRGNDDINMNPMTPINVGFYVSSAIAAAGFFALSRFVFGDGTVGGFGWLHFALANTFGILLSVLIEKTTEHFTAIEKKPVTECAKSAKTGSATVILSGFASGLESSVWSVAAVCGAIFAASILFRGDPALSAYGIALTGLGLLSTTGFMLAMDTYGPISDNANGIFEMSGALKSLGEDSDARRIVAKLDAVGNTTKALTKGLAIATAVIAATALFRSYMADIGMAETGIRIDITEVFIGLMLGGAVPFLFCSFAVNAVNGAAFDLVEEVRRQFREIKGIMSYDPGSGSDKGKPDYRKCVAISTAAAQKELLAPAVLAVSSPVFVGFALGYSEAGRGAAALGGFLVGTILCGQLLAVLLSNSGGLWDNAKKKIEDGMFGGKGTPEHKAAVVGDTVGDPFKDTAGPALNPLIKVINLVAVLVAPMAVTDISVGARTAVVVVSGLAVLGSVLWSKRKRDLKQ